MEQIISIKFNIYNLSMFFVRWQRREWKGTVPFKSRVFYMTSFLWCFGWCYWFCFWRISFATLGTETDGYDGLGWLGTQTDVAIKDEETDGNGWEHKWVWQSKMKEKDPNLQNHPP